MSRDTLEALLELTKERQAEWARQDEERAAEWARWDEEEQAYTSTLLEGVAGTTGRSVCVTVNGRFKVVGVAIDPGCADLARAEVEALIVAAANRAFEAAHQWMSELETAGLRAQKAERMRG